MCAVMCLVEEGGAAGAVQFWDSDAGCCLGEEGSPMMRPEKRRETEVRRGRAEPRSCLCSKRKKQGDNNEKRVSVFCQI